ncbi:cytochrome c oxidase subunit I [Anaerobacillus isosaccharinicus]|uniref:Cytochrome c oxidase subunit 1 n=1 Tax=Anaerobacillus isosaccharinicus TaxID=1532552 RepID=A0A1S2M9X5_9BACI|nr:cytochrome c oxidase subunit I [Anaerobacillus isosaccharinicus]MBA5587481.1 cytochrome c oxidase subunit I [Anaerobacillus isosaccharinicus]QOY34336.1 cytochrome c oxidase subunit I [Anaerobacillus isosaccharinicus]
MSNSQAYSKSVLWDWLTTVDHKKIGIMYLVAGAFFFVLGGLEAMLIRIQLMFPESNFVSAQAFNELITMHGTTMIFLAAMPLLFGFMNFIVPLQIGARDVAFPFLNSLGFWLFLSGGILLNLSWFFGGAPDAGWTAYVPLSSAAYASTGLDYYVLGLQISGAGTLIGGINFLVTIITMRAPGMTMMKMPLFTWSTFVASALILFAFPALTVGLFLLMFERLFGANYFIVEAGGNVVIWQHLFWIFGHPEVYILVLPAFGIFSEVLSTFSKKRLFGYSAMVFATLIIGFLGFMVWAHHMFTVGMGPVANAIFAVATMAIAVPTGIKIFNWLLTLWGGRISFTTANMFALGFIPSFVLGGVTGVMLATSAANYQFHDTYFVVAHFHYVIIGGVVFGLFSGTFYWWPKIFGTMLNETLGKWFFWLFFIGFHLTFFVQHFLGLMGMPRRVASYLDGQGLNDLNFISTIGAFFMAVAFIILLANIFVSRNNKAVSDPWDGRTLEWATSTPVKEYNFAQTPVVREIDALWYEKMKGNKKLPVAEPLGEIHMPNGSILPLIMSIGLFIASFGFIYHTYVVSIIGLGITLGCMIIRSVKEDHGYHIPVDQIEPDKEVV